MINKNATRQHSKALNFGMLYGVKIDKNLVNSMVYEMGRKHAVTGKSEDTIAFETIIKEHEDSYFNGFMAGLAEK